MQKVYRLPSCEQKVIISPARLTLEEKRKIAAVVDFLVDLEADAPEGGASDCLKTAGRLLAGLCVTQSRFNALRAFMNEAQL